MSESDDKLFEDAMANLELPPAATTRSEVAAMATALKDVVVAEQEATEAQLFDRAMANLEVGDEHRDEDGPPHQAEQQATGRRAMERAIRQGRLKPDVTLDLHGLNREQAWSALERCVLASRREGHSVLRVICGRGLHSRGPAVLLEALQGWLRGPLQEHVTASYPSAPADGGRGAWFLLLRSR